MEIHLPLIRILVVMSKSILYGVIVTCLFTSMLLAKEGNAQHKSIKEVHISLELIKASVPMTLTKIQEKTDFKFIYEKDVISSTSNLQLTLQVNNQSVANILKTISNKTKLTFRQLDGSIVIKVPTPKVTLPKENEVLLEQNISGKVTDEKGEALPGVSVLVKDTNIGVITDVDGNYRLSAPDEATTLIFSYVGYVRQEIAINGRSVVDVSLSLDVTTLGEVVVSTGYWEMEKRESTGNIAKVTSKEIEKQPVANPLQALQGRMAGVYIQQSTGLPGGGFFIQIRGRNSLRGVAGNNPLYLVDGIPFTPTSLTNVGNAATQANPLNSINPADIESIQILKDADATAIYGSRGANGVVLITTKKGKAGKTKVDVNFFTGVGEVAKKLDLLNTEQYLEMRNEAFQNDNATPGFFDDDVNGTWDPNRYTDWQDLLIGGTAHTTNAQATVSGGNSKTQFLFSGGYYAQTSVFPGDFTYQKGSGHFNLNHTSEDQKFKLLLSSTFTADKNNLPQLSFTTQAINLPPNAPAVYDSKGQLNWENWGFFFSNPIGVLRQKYEAATNNLVTNAILSYQPIPGLEFRSNIGYTILQMDEFSTEPINSWNPIFGVTTGASRFGDSQVRTWIIEPQASYFRDIGAGSLNVLIGVTFQEDLREDQALFASGFTSDALLEDLSAATDISTFRSNFSEYRYNAFFGRINYSLKDKYIINLTGRRDGSSRFGLGKQFANFGAVGAAWIFSNEGFLQNSFSFLSFGKLRASYGTTGSDQIGDYQYLDSYRTTAFPYQGSPGLIPSRLFNPDFQWETNKKLEASLTLGFGKDRVLLETSYYRNQSSNQLIGLPLSTITGFASVQANFPATVLNKGWELELNTINIRKKHLEWTTNINITFPRNELIEFPNIESTSFGNRFEVGKSIFIVNAYHHTGVDPETGVYTFEDVNADASISFPDDFQAIKEATQEYFGGVQNSIRYKGFQLDFLFQFVKQTGRNYLASFLNAPGIIGNQPTIVMDRWQNPGDVSTVQRFTQNGFTEPGLAYSNSTNFGDNRIGDASFIRLKNLSLSYHLPTQWTDKIGLQTSRVYIQGQNVLTITDYLGFDPENFNSRVLPPLRTITAGIQLTF